MDPTAGSGGFLLEVLMQVWGRVERDFAGQPESEIKPDQDRLRTPQSFWH